MDSLVVEDALSSYLEKEWTGSLDNEGLDFSQLDSYINDDNHDGSTYFGAELVGELKGGISGPLNEARNVVQNSSDVHHQVTPPTYGLTSYRAPPTNIVPSASIPILPYSRSTQSNNFMPPYSVHHHINYGHSLPDSPPDSSSEPPYSPGDCSNLSPNQKGYFSENLLTGAPHCTGVQSNNNNDRSSMGGYTLSHLTSPQYDPGYINIEAHQGIGQVAGVALPSPVNNSNHLESQQQIGAIPNAIFKGGKSAKKRKPHDSPLPSSSNRKLIKKEPDVHNSTAVSNSSGYSDHRAGGISRSAIPYSSPTSRVSINLNLASKSMNPNGDGAANTPNTVETISFPTSSSENGYSHPSPGRSVTRTNLPSQPYKGHQYSTIVGGSSNGSDGGQNNLNLGSNMTHLDVANVETSNSYNINSVSQPYGENLLYNRDKQQSQLHHQQQEDDLSMDALPLADGSFHTLLKSEVSPGNYSDQAGYQSLKFNDFQPNTWCTLCNSALADVSIQTFRVEADKGFNFSNPDDAFVCQKKNHFQVTIQAQLSGEANFVRCPDGLMPINGFHLHFYGVKNESPQQRIGVDQSQSDRSKKSFHPVVISLRGSQGTKVTVGRMHFSETTSNNMRKKGRPNPDQRFFCLVVSLEAVCGDNAYPIIVKASERIIVRASNPGQFESEVEYSFQRGIAPESIFHMGRVGINTDKPEESLVVHGNVKVTGQILQPSDRRAKKSIKELDTQEQLRNVQSLRVVKYQYKDDFAGMAGLNGACNTGVIAQEVQKILPDAVSTTGDVALPGGRSIANFLCVDTDRIFMENVGAVKELCKVTGNLENRIDELERMSNKISQLRRYESKRSNASSISTKTSGASTISSCSHHSNITGCPKSCSRSSRCNPQGLLRLRSVRSAPERSEEDEPCNNRTLQLITIVLVFVMALCLLFMAALYIFDHTQRKGGPFTSTTDTTFTTDRTSSTMHLTTSIPINFSSFPPSSLGSTTLTTTEDLNFTNKTSPATTTYTTVPMYSTTSATPTTTTITTTTSTSRATSPSTTSLSPFTTPSQHIRPPVLGNTENCYQGGIQNGPNCEVHCCPLQAETRASVAVGQPLQLSTVSPNTVTTASGGVTTTTRRYIMYGNGELFTDIAESTSGGDQAIITNWLSTMDPTTAPHENTSSSQSLDNSLKPVPSKKSGNHLSGRRTYSTNRKIKKTISKRALELHPSDGDLQEEDGGPSHRRRGRSIGISANVDGIDRSLETLDRSNIDSAVVNNCLPSVDIVELNATITHMYCLYLSQEYFLACTNGSSANLSYGVPLSMFMEHSFLTLKFNYQSPECVRVPHYCPPSNSTVPPLTPEPCQSHPPDTTVPGVVEGQGYTMVLQDVGLWETVAYRFRLPNHSYDPCADSPDNIGSGYLEYNFVFYRVCDA